MLENTPVRLAAMARCHLLGERGRRFDLVLEVRVIERDVVPEPFDGAGERCLDVVEPSHIAGHASASPPACSIKRAV
jgi:hypothetical protein